MRKTSKAHGIELNSRSRPVRDADFTHYDYILAMDQNNLRDLNTHQGRLDIQHPQLKRIREYDPEPGNLSVPDPYYGGDMGFEEVYQILKRSCTQMLDQMVSDHGL
jgi:protein-tyrosine phosphatase